LKENSNKKLLEVVIAKGYSIEEILDMDDDDFDEEPILTKEMRICFE